MEDELLILVINLNDLKQAQHVRAEQAMQPVLWSVLACRRQNVPRSASVTS